MHNSSRNWIHILGWSNFVRHYSENPCWFLFLRLIICLNSAGNLAWARIWFFERLNWCKPHRTTIGILQRFVAPVCRRADAWKHLSINLKSKRCRTKHTRRQVQEYKCVQISNDSRVFASHNAYRSLLRPSSLRESSHPSLKVLVYIKKRSSII